LKRTGTDLATFTSNGVLPDFERTPASLSLALNQTTALTALPGNLEIGTGSTIRTDPGAIVALSSDRSLLMNGTIEAPAGAIDLALTLPGAATDPGFDATQGIFLSDDARLLARGAVVLVPNDQNLRTGSVLPAGSVTLEAKRGYIVTAPHSVIDVSGTSQALDVVRAARSGNVIETVQGVAPAGQIAFTAAEGMLLNGELDARAADVPGAAGGTLSVIVDGASRDVDEADFSFGFGPRSIRLTSGRGPTIVEPGTPVPDAFMAFRSRHEANRIAASTRCRSQPQPVQSARSDASRVLRHDSARSRCRSHSSPRDRPRRTGDQIANGADAHLGASYVPLGPITSRRRKCRTASLPATDRCASMPTCSS
jgi:hypothetical protein